MSPDVTQLFLSRSEVHHVREAAYRTGNAGAWSNLRVLDDLADTRLHVARTIGFDSYADMGMQLAVRSRRTDQSCGPGCAKELDPCPWAGCVGAADGGLEGRGRRPAGALDRIPTPPGGRRNGRTWVAEAQVRTAVLLCRHEKIPHHFPHFTPSRQAGRFGPRGGVGPALSHGRGTGRARGPGGETGRERARGGGVRRSWSLVHDR